jgi:mRNA-degrading endonuclease toxin of MazEF toxin-antitoxin module
MNLGTRPIRTSGKGSGSVEVTLPAALRPMVGLTCRIWLHDGARPDIVLSPDLSPARAAFAQFHARLTAALSPGSVLPAWRAEDYGMNVSPRAEPGAIPTLAWSDGLALAAGGASDATIARVAHAALLVLAAPLSLAGSVAPIFAAAGAVLLSGQILAPAWQEATDLATTLLPAGQWRAPVTTDWQTEPFWQQAAPSLAALLALSRRWSTTPTLLAEVRASGAALAPSKG